MEERKFLDLDIICDQIPNEDDRKMFSEAIRCYQIGSHRAAVILAWSVTADCLSRRIDELAAENDGSAQKARTALHKLVGAAMYEEVLIVQAKVCDLVDDYDEKCLRFARDTRSKCAHPTGVIPSAEAVRHILHICSQTVLCRNGYRGIAFVQHFVKTKLKDRHLFSNRQRINDDCRYFIEKVSERVQIQFGAEISKHFDNASQDWLDNTLIFSKGLFSLSSIDIARKIAAKLQGIEAKDRLFFSTIVGIEERQGVWDAQELNQSKSHLREALKSGKVDDFQFYSYGNLCALSTLDEEDIDLLKSRFGLFIEHISKHLCLQNICRTSLVSLVVDALGDEKAIREQVLKGLSAFSSLQAVFTDELVDKNTQLINRLIQEDWRNENIANVWQSVSLWSSSLLVALLKQTENFFIECSEDSPDDILAIFDAVNSLINKSPNLLPEAFEESIKHIVEQSITPPWYSNEGETYQNFIGQVDLLKERHSSHFSFIPHLTLSKQHEEDVDADVFN